MKKNILLVLLFAPLLLHGQTPTNDDCSRPVLIDSGPETCPSILYTTVGATPSSLNSGNDVWFTYTPLNGHDLFVTVYGAGNGGTLQNPIISVAPACPPGNTFIGSTTSANNVTSYYVGGLTIGTPYLISVRGSNTGTFKICTQNQSAPTKPGQDCATAKFLCSQETVRESNVSGGGDDINEAKGTCFEDYPETNSAWFKWIAANNGTLVFTITPTDITDDMDWVLFDLGPSGNCSAKIAIACANGYGGNGPSGSCAAPGSPENYYKTGLDFNSDDTGELAGCVRGQDGKVRFITMQQGHVYALMVNNAFAQGNGFKIDFTDQEGRAGTGMFEGPKAIIDLKVNQPCTVSQNYTFTSVSTAATSVEWDFGQGASIQTSTQRGPINISYSTPGQKTVVLTAIGSNGCYTIATRIFYVGLKPQTPDISANKLVFCVGETLTLSTSAKSNLTYKWTGPNGFSAETPTVNIPITSVAAVGSYSVVAIDGDCISDPVTINIPTIYSKPIAAFKTVPALPAKLSVPVTIKFFNQSTNADSYHWDFGDGSSSAEANPEHEYITIGSYDITLVAFRSNVCSFSITRGTFVITADNAIFIPNTFTPNGDNINDEFVVTMSNLQSYKIRIYNRWGAPVFESIDIFDNWKGLYQGQPLPTGVYYYAIEAVGLNNNTIKRSGSITIIK